jgi:SAM-dependent methyltransferase
MNYLPQPEKHFPSSSNSVTIESYEKYSDQYVKRVPAEVTGSIKTWIDASIDRLPKDADIFEIGSGTGRDAAYIEDQGFSVTRTDATHAFVELMRSTNARAEDFNILTEDLPIKLDMVFADAVFLHFTGPELDISLNKIYDSLKQGGRLAFTLIEGQGESWSSGTLGAPRYFNAWPIDVIKEKLEDLGFTDVDITKGDFKWLHVIATKPAENHNHL